MDVNNAQPAVKADLNDVLTQFIKNANGSATANAQSKTTVVIDINNIIRTVAGITSQSHLLANLINSGKLVTPPAPSAKPMPVWQLVMISVISPAVAVVAILLLDWGVRVILQR